MRTQNNNTSAVYKIIVGIFNGENLLATDTNLIYNIPGNYASKSKLVEGDKMKLYIQTNGTYIFKQVEMVPRVRFLGKVMLNGDNEVRVEHIQTGELYQVIPSSIRYFDMKPSDTYGCLTSANSSWAAIDSVVEKADLNIDAEAEYEDKE